MARQSTFTVVDPESRQNVCVIVRETAGGVGLALSIEKDGDFEAFLPPEVALQGASALTSTAKAIQERA